ncbi:MAG TPA: M23 family metallopeptidase [Pseudonocardiaceae bacterium]|nr:M23 family metallopeptidase [Pseudonocardiaceae bacterium]
MPARRLSAPSGATRGRVLFAAVAIGAVAAAVAGRSLVPSATPTALAATDGTAVVGTNADDSRSLDVQPVRRGLSASAEAQQLAEAQQITGQQSVDTPARPGHTAGATFTSPARGHVIATFGGQYGAFHYGIEIANVKDTPIVAVADGVIIAAGPADGFGLWVKEQLSDGTTLVYARMDTFSVQVGQHVTAAQRIALMGDRGFGTGYTLHFEVWDPAGKKIDPESWLNERGVTV